MPALKLRQREGVCQISHWRVIDPDTQQCGECGTELNVSATRSNPGWLLKKPLGWICYWPVLPTYPDKFCRQSVSFFLSFPRRMRQIRNYSMLWVTNYSTLWITTVTVMQSVEVSLR